MKLNTNIINRFGFILLSLISISSKAQFNKITTNTSATLQDLSIIGNCVMVSGFFDYLGRSKDKGESLTALSLPTPTGCVTRMEMIDSTNIFVLRYSPSQTYLYQSSDGGDNWLLKSITSGAFSHYFGFFDTTSGMRTDGPFLEKSVNGGTTWTNVPCPFTVGTTALKTFGDSLVCVGGVDASGRGLVLSKNRGKTWSSGWGILGHNVEITGFSFVSNDTIIAFGTAGIFVYTLDGGTNWIDTSEPPIYDYFDAKYIKSGECFVVGGDAAGYGIVTKTTDFGKTWSTLNTGFKTILQNIEILNDSIALIVGTDGTLLKWNYKTSIFTGLNEQSKINDLSVYPNPVNDEVFMRYDDTIIGNAVVYDMLGQKIIDQQVNDNKINVAILSPGVYYLEVLLNNHYRTFKIIKN